MEREQKELRHVRLWLLADIAEGSLVRLLMTRYGRLAGEREGVTFRGYSNNVDCLRGLSRYSAENAQKVAA